MSKFKCKGVDQTAVNAELRQMFGETATRQDLLAYRERTGVDPKWIRRNPAARTGRGLYRIPGATDAPVQWDSGVRMGKHERPVMETPFDSGDYDGDAAPKPAKRGRKAADDSTAEFNRPDYDPTIGERAAPQIIHAWICENRECVGRKPGDFLPADGSVKPTCECGSPMMRHSWERKRRI